MILLFRFAPGQGSERGVAYYVVGNGGVRPLDRVPVENPDYGLGAFNQRDLLTARIEVPLRDAPFGHVAFQLSHVGSDGVAGAAGVNVRCTWKQ